MSKKFNKAVASTVACLVVTSVVQMPAFAATTVKGNDRVLTAIEIAEQSWTGAWKGQTTAVLTSKANDNLVDALAVAPLAFQEKAPILLTDAGDTVNPEVMAELAKNKVTKVYLTAGTGVLTEKMEKQLKDAKMEVIRLGGANRYETAKNIAAKLTKINGVAVVNGEAIIDALSVASIAAANGYAIAMTSSKDAAPDNITKDVPVFAIGGSGVISDAVVAGLKATRLGGDTRYSTNAAVIDGLKEKVKFDKIYVANGTDKGVDALAGSVLAAQTNSPIIITSDALDATQTKLLKSKASKDAVVIQLGGTVGAVTEVEASLKPEVPVSKAEIKPVSASSVANNQVNVVLDSAPFVQLTANDFSVSGLQVLGVTVNNNVATLITSPQASGSTYTVTTTKGSTTFTGMGATNGTSGIIKSVKVLNSRQLRVDFISAVLASSVTKDNLYLGMTETLDADLTKSSLQKLDATNKLEIVWYAADDKAIANDDDKDKKDVSYVVIQTKVNAAATEATGPDTLTDAINYLQYNKQCAIEARNVKDKNGYIHTSEGSFVLADTDAPNVASATVVYTDGDKALYKKADGTLQPRIKVSFTEPIKSLKYEGNTIQDFMIYIDGVAVTKADISQTVKQTETPSTATQIMNNAPVAGTVSQNKTVWIDVPVDKYAYGSHDIKIVGALDYSKSFAVDSSILNANDKVLTPNVWSGTFTIEKQATKPTQYLTPKVVSIKQIEDNLVEVTFDQKDVVTAGSSDAKVFVVKNAKWDSNSKKFIDYVITKSEIDNQSITSMSIVKNDKDVEVTKWTIKLDATLNKTEAKFSYDDSSIISRDVVINNYGIKGQTGVVGYEGDEYTQVFNFIRDAKAPIIGSNIAYKIKEGKLYVSFTDAPFNGNIQLENIGTVKVSKTTSSQVTTDAEVSIGSSVKVGDTSIDVDGKSFTKQKYVVVDLTVETSGKTLLTSDNYLNTESVYTVTFRDNQVRDADVTPENQVEQWHKMQQSAAQVYISKLASTSNEGLVPQTSKALIASGRDYIIGGKVAASSDLTGLVSMVGSIEYMRSHANYIMVTFDGEVLEASAVNKSNYTINGASLPSDAVVTFYTDNINNQTQTSLADTKDGFVIIQMPTNSIAKDGEYTITVSNVSNKSGKKMLPIVDSVTLVDNTKPVAKSLKVVGSRQLELTFDETITVKGADLSLLAKATNNFSVYIDGVKYNVATVSFANNATKGVKLILTTNADFDKSGSIDVNARVTVQLDGTNNNAMWMVDEEGNILSDNISVSNK